MAARDFRRRADDVDAVGPDDGSRALQREHDQQPGRENGARVENPDP